MTIKRLKWIIWNDNQDNPWTKWCEVSKEMKLDKFFLFISMLFQDSGRVNERNDEK